MLRPGVLLLLLIPVLYFGCKRNQGYEENLQEHRNAIDVFFADPKMSPLSDAAIKDFKGLSYFEPDKAFIVNAVVEKFSEKKVIEIPHTLNRKYPFYIWGKAHFKLLNDSCHLYIYLSVQQEEEHKQEATLFIPFHDATNGNETYGAGRYLDVPIPKDSLITLDFNYAYNPDCAYSDNYSCPIIPVENTLKIPVRAGVKRFDLR